ncbi:MAG TPA: DUF4080 domain-containing protein [Candidatus Hydrogenedentes bacterium]|nr:DUF4080 domain-containing protein [Candidatus Hydrogenedentota bacterium]HNT89135.1 DUF4080 domain-containing protein [Candidatus Hydrogenedentota bacterium]
MTSDAPAQPRIVLATINARYTHTAYGLRCVWSALGDLRAVTAIREFTLEHPPLDIAERLLTDNPEIIGLGVYIWNVAAMTRVVQAIKAVRPEVVVVLGGPEVGYEYEDTPIFAWADYLVRGEGEEAFPALAAAVLGGEPPPEKVISAPPADLARLPLPYDAYTPEDIEKRVVYVEASRGCPFDCEFCLSALDERVREFPMNAFLEALGRLIARGARRINFVDRTFNLKPRRVAALLAFLHEHWRDGLRVHFEIVPDRLSPAMLEWMARFPAGGLHLEVGVQTFHPEAQAAISRRQNLEKTEETLRFLRTQTGALLHADLVAGLPCETWDSFGAGFDRLTALEPHEIQVGILKRLKGAPIARHIPTHAMAFADTPPYEILQTDLLDFAQLQRIKRFARYFDLYCNSGNFPTALGLLWRTRASRFEAFMGLSDWIWTRTQRTHQFPLEHLVRLLFTYLTAQGVDPPETIAAALETDYHRLPGRRERLRLSGAG